jgi:hypothetical protein
MAGLSTNASGLWGGFAGLLYGSTALSTPPGFLADAPPAWVPAGGVLAFEFDNGLGYNSRNLATTTPDSILTYTNPSAKLVYGSDGVLRYARYNLFLQSVNLVTSWTSTNLTATANAAVAPDGSTTAASLIPTTASAAHKQGQTVTVGVTRNYEFSVKLKANGYNKIALNEVPQTASSSKIVDLRDGSSINATGTVGTTTVTDAGNGYWLIKWLISAQVGASKGLYIVVLPDSASAATNPNSFTWVPDGVSGVLAAEAAVCDTPYHNTTYLPTTTAAVYSLPIDHDPITFDPLGVLIEEERKNLILQSQTFGTTWAPTSASISANAGVAPDGTTTADKLIGAAASAVHFLVQTVVISNATVYTYSVYAKKVDGARYLNLAGPTAAFGAGNFVGFDLQTGVVLGSPVGFTGVIQDIGGGWYRCIATSVASASLTGDFFIVLSDGSLTRAPVYTPNGTDGVLLWGAQLE